jgi:hypothetical protein
MYNFQITHLNQGHVIQLQVSTNLVNPFTYGGVIIEKVLGTDCIRINNEKYRIPVNRMNHIEINEGTFIGFGYFLTED